MGLYLLETSGYVDTDGDMRVLAVSYLFAAGKNSIWALQTKRSLFSPCQVVPNPQKSHTNDDDQLTESSLKGQAAAAPPLRGLTHGAEKRCSSREGPGSGCTLE